MLEFKDARMSNIAPPFRFCDIANDGTVTIHEDAKRVFTAIRGSVLNPHEGQEMAVRWLANELAYYANKG